MISTWNSLIDATFDTGVVIVSSDRAKPAVDTHLGTLWFQDEDEWIFLRDRLRKT
ncbi:MAG TPA: hypothetical protein VK203_13685 [Nostocaceae cyanobacterium]|nr:hypothetical protein [Nostocaceae cyanobacterium]